MKKNPLKKMIVVSVLAALLLIIWAIIAGCTSAPQETTPSAVSEGSEGSKEKIEGEAGALEEAAAFFKGKIITCIVPHGAGGGFDVNARVLAPYLEKYTGATVIVKNVEGGGGMLGVNELYTAQPDGLTIGIQNAPGSVINQLTELEGVAYDLLKFAWIGRVSTDARVLVMRSDYPYKTFEEMANSGETIIIGATGLGGATYVDAVITSYALDYPIELIHGYNSSSEVDMAMFRGEVDGFWGSYASRIPMLNSGEQFVILQNGKKRAPEMPDVPTWFEVAKTEKASSILEVSESMHATGRPFAAPPGLPEGRLEFLREAFEKAVNDPAFAEDLAKTGHPLDYLPGEDLPKLFETVLNMPADIKEIFVKAMKGEI